MQEVETVNFGKCGILNKEYIIPVYKYLYEHQEEYGFTHFRFEGACPYFFRGGGIYF